MAVQEFSINLKWENNNFFSMDTKKNSDPKVTDIRIEENAHINIIWASIQAACLIRLKQLLDDIGSEMKVP